MSDWRDGKVTPKLSDSPRPDDESMGWKPNPDGPGLRYWNGRQWTETRQHVAPAFTIDAHHLLRQRAFSTLTFGPGPRVAGVVDHIRKELDEVTEKPWDVSEWADVVILALDGALRQGFPPQVILDAIFAKQVKNEQRQWPDWRTQDTDKMIEHVREETE